MKKNLPPIEIVKLTAAHDKSLFTLKAKDLPADILNAMTEEERIERYKEERKAINAEWARIRGVN